MSTSILTSVKKLLGIAEADTVFDLDIILHINSVFSVLNQFGIGPDDGFAIEDKESTWADFLGPDKPFNMVKSYVVLRVRLLFDPPQTSYLVTAYKEQIAEFEGRSSIQRELKSWVNPNPAPVTESVIDGGTP